MRSLVMRCFSFCKDGDIARQGPKNDGNGSEKKTTIKMAIRQVISDTKKIISKTAKLPEWCFHWDVAFLVVCIVAVAVDPLFYYLPVINEATKCIAIDTTLKIIAICVRSFLDLIALGDLVARIKNNCPDMKSSDYVINILSILPVIQVLMPIIFSEMRTSKIENKRKFLNAVVLSQYVPRIFRIYRLWKIVNENINILPKGSTKVNVESNKNIKIRPKGFIVMKAGFNLFLYLVASHALGAFWYFFSIQRETACWYKLVCKHDINGCSKGISLDCGTGGFGNYTFLNDLCSIENPNTTLFDFGIFKDARQSGILSSMDFPRKTMFCFWWGLRNLSSFGQNLQTSTYYWENCFTVLISIFGLLLFLYFIGNLQVYMQWETSNELLEIESKWLKNKVQEKIFRTIEPNLISKMGQVPELKKVIMDCGTRILEDQNNDFDTENPFPHLFKPIRSLIKFHLGLPRLQKVPIFENLGENLLSKITYEYLKQVQYNQNNFIVREKRHLDAIIFVVRGIVMCTCTRNHDDKTGCPEKFDLIGESLVEWVLESSKKSKRPLSTRNLKCQEKVEAFYLTAKDLKDIKFQYWWKFRKFRNNTQFDSEQLKHLAASSIQRVWRGPNHSIHPKKERTSTRLRSLPYSYYCRQLPK